MRKKLALSLAALVLVAVGLAVGALLTLRDRPKSGLDTVLSGISLTPATVQPPAVTTSKREAESCWPTFGGNPQRTLARPELHLGRPAKAVWVRAMGQVMEFPPTACDGRLYVNLEYGKTLALDAASGRVLWTYQARGAAPSSPAVAGPRLIVTSTDGAVTALDRAHGRVLWQLRTSARIESSPVVVDGTVFVGAWDGRLFALDVRTGRTRWAYDTGGRINASASVLGDRVCIDNYAGSIFCLRRRDGQKLWRTDVKRDIVRYESFYASPSTDGRRIFAAARSGKVLALDPSSGETLWTRHVGALTYATPAVAKGRLFVGGFDGTLHAYRAKTGETLWERHVGGRIISPALVVGDLVFFSTLENRTYAARVRDGALVWSVRGGKYSPGIATNRRYYLSLNGRLMAVRGTRTPSS